MKARFPLSALAVAVTLLSACSGDDDSSSSTAKEIHGLRFIGEQTLTSRMDYQGTTVGGLSSIDYHDGTYYLISDDAASDSDAFNGPIRFYTASFDITENSFGSVSIDSVVELKNSDQNSFGAGAADPESLRIDPESGNLVWVSEGFINADVQPFIREQKTDGSYVRDFDLPEIFKKPTGESATGPRHNTSFEGISLSHDGKGYWAVMEGPLQQDGDAPSFTSAGAPVRVVYFNKTSGEVERQFALDLNPETRIHAQPGFPFEVNGMVEILEYAADKFLLLERSYATNYKDGGNNVKVYRVDASEATDVNSITPLDNTVVTATKTEIFDFEAIRHQLTDNIVDNIEGITFGPQLANGNRTLVMVADDNFSAFGPQLNQFVAFEVLEEKQQAEPAINISSLSFIGEKVLTDTDFEGTTVGGLSSIDYAYGQFFMISDDNANASDSVNGPVRYYTADLSFDEDSFDSITITSVNSIKTLVDGAAVDYSANQVDPEGLRVNPETGNLVWVSEGNINGAISPFVKEMGRFGEVIREFRLPGGHHYDAQSSKGPRHNLAFEGLALSHDGKGYWAAMEGPLAQDGTPPTTTDADGPARIAYINQKSGEFGRQFAYPLDPVVVRSGGEASFKVSGLVEILNYAQDQFLVMERSFTAGQADGGNNVKIYKVDSSNATNIAATDALIGAAYTPATKELLFDFETVRDQLSTIGDAHIVDNIEGMTFGPRLPNGNLSLVLVADDNFSAFGAQLNQFVVLEVKP